MHVGKTKVMINTYAVNEPIRVNGNVIEAVDKYVYLVKTITQSGDIDVEIKKAYWIGQEFFRKVEPHPEKQKNKSQNKE